jgi:hypothetical protein
VSVYRPRCGLASRNLHLPTEVRLREGGDAVACYAGVPLIRFQTLDALLARFGIAHEDLVECLADGEHSDE